jgi:hypothetical protein
MMLKNLGGTGRGNQRPGFPEQVELKTALAAPRLESLQGSLFEQGEARQVRAVSCDKEAQHSENTSSMMSALESVQCLCGPWAASKVKWIECRATM